MFDPAKNPGSRYDSYGGLKRGSEFGAETDESGESTPPLWRTSPTRYRDLSPEAKTQAIMRGQMELMEMVGRMPESSYELSLRDLVERPSRRQENFMEEQRVNIDREISTQRREQEVARKKKLQIMNRNGSMENKGFLLKMGFPLSNWGSSKKKKKKKLDSKVLPKPVVAASAEGGGEEWWKNRYVVSAGESESVVLSSNSGSSKSSDSSSSSRSSRVSGGSSRCVLNEFSSLVLSIFYNSFYLSLACEAS